MSSPFYGPSKTPLNNYDDGSRYPPNHMDTRGMQNRNGGPDLRMLANRPPMDNRGFIENQRPPSMDRSYQSSVPRGFDPSDGRLMDHRIITHQPQNDLRNNPPQRMLGNEPRFPFPTTSMMPMNQGSSGLNPLISGQQSLPPTRQQQQLPPPMIMQQFQRPSVSERVQVPSELSAFAAEPKFQQILLRVKEQTNVNFISVNRVADNVVESVAIDAASKESADLAKNLIETHLKLQMKIKAAENRLQKVQTDLFSTQGEIAAGHVVECSVIPELIGLAIGKKGARIKQIESETGVSSINVADSGKITIYGPDATSVQKAREQLELIEDCCPVTERQAEWFSDKMNASYLVDLRTSSNLMVAKLNREELQLDIVGTVPAVQMAKCLWSTQLEYVDRQIEIEEDERQVREQLHAVRKQYGFQNSRGKSSGGKSVGNIPTGSESAGPGKGGNNNTNARNERNQPESSSKVSAAPNGGFANSANDRGRKTLDIGVESIIDKIPDQTIEKPFDALDALITYTPQDEKMGKSNKKQASKEKELKPTGDVFKEKAVIDSIETKSKKIEKHENRVGKIEARTGRTVVEVRSDGPDRTSDKTSDKPKKAKTSNQDHSDQIEALNDRNGKGNKEKAKSAKSAGQSGGNLPPPPTLTVPPPPADGKSEGKKKGSEKKITSDNKTDNDKQPMLVKINNPFLEQKNAKKVPEPEVLPPEPPTAPPGLKMFGPPKEPPKNVAPKKTDQSVEKVDRKDTSKESAPMVKGNSRNKERAGKKEHSDLLTKVEIISVVTDDQQLVANLSAMKVDSNKIITEHEPDRNISKKGNNKKKGKGGESPPDEGNASKDNFAKSINGPTTEIPIASDEIPLPKRVNTRKGKDFDPPENDIPQMEAVDDSVPSSNT